MTGTMLPLIKTHAEAHPRPSVWQFETATLNLRALNKRVVFSGVIFLGVCIVLRKVADFIFTYQEAAASLDKPLMDH